MAIGKGLTAFLAAYYKSQELAQKQAYYDLQLAYLRQKQAGGVPKGAEADQSAAEKGYTPRWSGLKEGRSVGDPVSTDMAPHQRAFLNAVAAPESGGEYDRMYAGMDKNTPPTYFEGYDAHPDIAAPGPAGPSTAAGRYMFTKSTWDRLGGGSFDPANQDKRAWELAKQDYASRTGGRDLDTELRTNGFTPQIASTLSPTWTGFKANPQLAAGTYYSSLSRYNQPQVAEGSAPSALPITGTATAALTAAPLPPPRPDNLGQALPVEAGVTSPTPLAYAPEAYPQAIPVDYAGYDPYNTEAIYAAKGGLVPDLRQRWVQHFQNGGDVNAENDFYQQLGLPANFREQAAPFLSALRQGNSASVTGGSAAPVNALPVPTNSAIPQAAPQAAPVMPRFNRPNFQNIRQRFAPQIGNSGGMNSPTSNGFGGGWGALNLGQGYNNVQRVQHFQGGGEVENDPYIGANDPDPANYQALYTGAGDMGGVPTQQTQPAQPQFNNPVSALLNTASDAVTAGVKWLHDKFGVANASLSGIGEHAGLKALANHEGAAPAADVQEAEDAVDPGKHLDAGGRRLAGMNAAYQYYLAHGEETKAKAVAGSMLMYSKQVAAEAADMALRAPNPIAGAQILAQGHNQIPGAPQFQVDDNGNYVVKDPKTGRPINAGVVSPQQLLAAARGMKDGSVFWRTLSAYAKPDENEETTAEKKQRLKEEATNTAIKTLGMPGTTAGPATVPAGAPANAPAPGALPVSGVGTPPGAPAADNEDDTEEGRSAGTGAPPKAGMKPAVAAAYTQLPATFEETLDTPEKQQAYLDLLKHNPGAVTVYQNRHAQAVQRQAEQAAAAARANAPEPDVNKSDITTAAKADKSTNDAWDAFVAAADGKKNDKGEVFKAENIPAADVEGFKTITRGIVQKEGGSPADALSTGMGLVSSAAKQTIPTKKDDNGKTTIDWDKWDNVKPYVTKTVKGQLYVIPRNQDGIPDPREATRITYRGLNTLDKMTRAAVQNKFEAQQKAAEPGVLSRIMPGIRTAGEAIAPYTAPLPASPTSPAYVQDQARRRELLGLGQ